jgi:hypothetical protein
MLPLFRVKLYLTRTGNINILKKKKQKRRYGIMADYADEAPMRNDVRDVMNCDISKAFFGK